MSHNVLIIPLQANRWLLGGPDSLTCLLSHAAPSPTFPTAREEWAKWCKPGGPFGAQQPHSINPKEAVNLDNEIGIRHSQQLSCSPAGYPWGCGSLSCHVLLCRHTGKPAQVYCSIRTWQAALNTFSNLFNTTSTPCWIQLQKISWKAEHRTHCQNCRTRGQMPECKKHPRNNWESHFQAAGSGLCKHWTLHPWVSQRSHSSQHCSKS